MRLEEMLLMIQDRTKIRNNDEMLIRELNAALDYCWSRIYPVCPNVEITFNTTGTFAADIQQFDLGAEIELLGGEFYGMKTFWIQGAGDQQYVPVVFMDPNDPRFIAMEQSQAQVLQPVTAAAVDFSQIRFSPALPSGTNWRADWIGKPHPLSLATNCHTSIPSPVHQAVVDNACNNIFATLDDSRDSKWQRDSENKIIIAIHNIKQRQQQTPQRTRPFPRKDNGWDLSRNA